MNERNDQEASVNIQRMDIRLPQGFKHRADGIARRAATELSHMAIDRSVRLDRIDLPPLRINGGETDAIIALQIARAIHAYIGAGDGVNARGRGGED